MIVEGNALAVLPTLPEASVQACVTSPPYWGLRDYGIAPVVWSGDPGHDHAFDGERRLSIDNGDKRRWNHAVNGRGEEQPEEKRLRRKSGEVSQGAFCECGAWRGSLGLEPTPDLYVEHLTALLREVRRVLRSNGTLWLNLGDCYATGAGKVGEHPGGVDRLRDEKRGYRGDRLANDHGGPAVLRKKTRRTAERSGYEGKQGYRVGPLTQPNRMPIHGLKPKDLVGIPWRVAFALQADGWWLRSDIIWSKPNPMPESVTDRPTKAHEYVFLLSKSERYFFDAAAVRERAVEGGDCSSPSEWARGPGPHTAIAHTAEGGEYRGIHAQTDRQARGRRLSKNVKAARDAGGSHDNPFAPGRNIRSVWTVATSPFLEAHFATFPTELPRRCILAGSAKGDTVLDPFFGAGTVGLVAESLGRKWIGIELNPAYVALARRRVRGPLFAGLTKLG